LGGLGIDFISEFDDLLFLGFDEAFILFKFRLELRNFGG
jgi:hypothetical protein